MYMNRHLSINDFPPNSNKRNKQYSMHPLAVLTLIPSAAAFIQELTYLNIIVRLIQ